MLDLWFLKEIFVFYTDKFNADAFSRVPMLSWVVGCIKFRALF